MITGFVGLIGMGKTMLAADDAISIAQRRGALLASNIRLIPPPDSGVEFVPLLVGDEGLDTDQIEVLVDRCKREGRGLVLFIDEVGIIMPARFWQSFPIGLMFMLSQSRKLALDLIWTSQDVEQVDAFLRRLTQWVYLVKSFPSPSIERREKGKRPWVMLRDKYRPAHVTGGNRDKRVSRDWLRYRIEREAVYDTDELVRPPARLRSGSRRQSPAKPEVKETNGQVGSMSPERAQRSGAPALGGLTWGPPSRTALLGVPTGPEDRTRERAEDRTAVAREGARGL